VGAHRHGDAEPTASPASLTARAAPLSRPVSSTTRQAQGLQRRAQGLEVLPRQDLGRGHQGRLAGPPPAASAMASIATTVLPEPDVALKTSRAHPLAAGQVAAEAPHRVADR
jgi:hypothetical protein